MLLNIELKCKYKNFKLVGTAIKSFLIMLVKTIIYFYNIILLDKTINFYPINYFNRILPELFKKM